MLLVLSPLRQLIYCHYVLLFHSRYQGDCRSYSSSRGSSFKYSRCNRNPRCSQECQGGIRYPGERLFFFVLCSFPLKRPPEDFPSFPFKSLFHYIYTLHSVALAHVVLLCPPVLNRARLSSMSFHRPKQSWNTSTSKWASSRRRGWPRSNSTICESRCVYSPEMCGLAR